MAGAVEDAPAVDDSRAAALTASKRGFHEALTASNREVKSFDRACQTSFESLVAATRACERNAGEEAGLMLLLVVPAEVGWCWDE